MKRIIKKQIFIFHIMGGYLRYISILLLLLLPFLQVIAKDTPKHKAGSIIVYEGFENGMPSGWTQQFIHSPEGQNAPWEIRTGAGIINGATLKGYPLEAAVGEKNLTFQREGVGHITKLITTPINLEFVINPELSFYHAQNPWGDDPNDILRIYYREGVAGSWILLRSYLHEVPDWTHRTIQLPSSSDKFYLALEGTSSYGMGVCIDELTITETGLVERELSHFETEQASTNFMPTGSFNNPILKSEIRVIGNTGSLKLNTYTAHSMNTSDTDLAPSGVKLYFTESEVFNTQNLIGAATDFNNGVVTFTNLDFELPTGYSYVWLTYDIDENAQQGNYADAYIPKDGVIIAGENLPETDHSPQGRRIIYKTIFYDNFETDKNWILTGEWERDVPQGLGGSHGLAGASYAYTGTKVLGTDLTGLGAYPGDYEPNLDSLAYQAITPELDCFYFNNISLSFHQWLNIEFSDRAFIHISTDGGLSWEEIWNNNQHVTSTGWIAKNYKLHMTNRQERVRVRFSIGPTDGSQNYSGWNIDNLVITGTYVTRDVGIAEWIGSDGGCGMSDSEPITVRVKNYGAEPITDPIPIGFSLDGGQTWHMDEIHQTLQVDESMVHTFEPLADFSIPGRYNNVIVKTFLEGDQDDTNDALEQAVFSVPIYTPPYANLFIENDGLWTGFGTNSSWNWGKPNGNVLDTAKYGVNAWVTNSAGVYNSNEASWLESPCFDFSQMENPVLDFFLQTHTPEGMDGVSLQHSLDQGLTWNQTNVLHEDFAWNWVDNTPIQKLNQAFNQDLGWHGNSEGWKRVRAILDTQTAFSGLVKFRLIFAADEYTGESNVWEGIGFDGVNIYEAPHDVGVTALLEPNNACELSEQESVTIQIDNLGFNTIDAGTVIPLGVDIANIPTVYEQILLESNLAPGQSVNYTFEALFDLSQEGTHAVTAYTMLPGDNDFYYEGVYNDTLFSQYTVYGYTDFTLGDDIPTLSPDTLVLDAGSGFMGYLWQDGSTNQTFQVTSSFTDVYTVSITDDNGCVTTDSLKVIAYDLEIAAISNPVSDCELSEEEYIKIEIRNSGPDIFESGTLLPLELFYNGNFFDYTEFVLEEALAPTGSVYYTFSNPIDFSDVGEYKFSIVLDFKDASAENNLLDYSIFVHGYPQPYIGDTLYNTDPVGIQIDAGDSYIDYVWQDGFTGQIYEISNPNSDWYQVNVIDQYGCPGSDSVHVISYDLEIIEVFEPLESCELSAYEPIGIGLFNHSFESFGPGDMFPFILEYQGEILAEDTLKLTEDWPANTRLDYQFNHILNMEATQIYDFRVYLKHKDANPTNDTLAFSVNVHGFPDIFIPPFIVTDNPEIITLDPGPGFESYLWHDGSTEQTFHITTWGEFWVEVSNDFGCTTYASTEIVPELFDISVTDIVSPGDFCSNTGGQLVRIQVENTGHSALPAGSQITLSFYANDQKQLEQSFELQTNLTKGSTRIFTLADTWTSTEPGNHTLSATVDYPYDEVPENNSFATSIIIHDLPHPQLGGTIYTLQADTLTLASEHVFTSYLWQDGSTSPSFDVQQLQSESYSLRVTDDNGCANTETVKIISYDLQLDEIIKPINHCVLTHEEKMHVRLKITGYDNLAAGEIIKIGYRIDDTQHKIEEFELTENWNNNTTKDFLFSKLLNLSSKEIYNLEAFVATRNANPSTDTLTTQVKMEGIPQINLGADIYTQKPDTVVLDAGPGFESYSWHNGQNTQQFNVSDYGWNWVIVYDQFGCMASDTIFVGSFVNIAPLTTTNLVTNVYPNPTRDILFVESDGIMGDKLSIEIYDMQGALVLSKNGDNDGLSRKSIDVSLLHSGTYIVVLRNKNHRKTHMISIIK